MYPIETFTIRDAVEYLCSTPNKTCVVDIFARNDDGSIKIQDGKIEIHALSLYAKKDEDKVEILVIDPSNSDFSKHIVSNSQRILFGIEYPNVQILAPKLQIKIYTPAGETGPNLNQYRDCIDIAVKICFGLSKHDGEVDISKLAELESIKEVTNNQALNVAIFFNPSVSRARIRQASDDSIREDVDKIMKKINLQIESLKLLVGNSRDLKDVSIKSISTLFPAERYDDCIQEMKILYKDNCAFFKKMIDHEMIEVVGDLQGNDGG